MQKKPIQIKVNADIPDLGSKEGTVACDDAILIFSNISGAVMSATKSGDPSLTREVGAWVAGFQNQPEVLTRLSQGVLQMFMASDSEKVNQYNVLNLIQFLIHNSGLEGKVVLTAPEDLLTPPQKEEKKNA